MRAVIARLDAVNRYIYLYMIKDIFDGKNNLNYGSFVRYILVGGSATIIHYALMLLLIEIFVWKYTVASGFGYVFSSVYNYLANSKYVFKNKNHYDLKVFRFYFVSFIGLMINVGVLSVGMYYFVDVMVAQILATIVVLFWNYLLNAIWTFDGGFKS
jgi:putative flippase GtrA